MGLVGVWGSQGRRDQGRTDRGKECGSKGRRECRRKRGKEGGNGGVIRPKKTSAVSLFALQEIFSPNFPSCFFIRGRESERTVRVEMSE